MNTNPHSLPDFETIEPDLTSHDPYHVLGIDSTADAADIKRAYFSLIRRYPPETEAEAFKRIRAAYEKLKDAVTRREIDTFRPQPPEPMELLNMAILAAPNPNAIPLDAQLLLKYWGELGRSNFEADFREIKL